MKKTIVSLICAVILASGSKIALVESSAPPYKLLSDYTVTELVGHYSSIYGVSAVQMTNTIQCESQFNENAVGDHGTSFGLVQIHNPIAQGVTIQEAKDKVFAIRFMAQAFAEGHQSRWSCYTTLYSVKSKTSVG